MITKYDIIKGRSSGFIEGITARARLAARSGDALDERTTMDAIQYMGLLMEMGDAHRLSFSQQNIALGVFHGLRQHHPEYLADAQPPLSHRGDNRFRLNLTKAGFEALAQAPGTDPRTVLRSGVRGDSVELVRNCIKRLQFDENIPIYENCDEVIRDMMRVGMFSIVDNKRAGVYIADDRLGTKIYAGLSMYAPELLADPNYGSGFTKFGNAISTSKSRRSLQEIQLSLEAAQALVAAHPVENWQIINAGASISGDKTELSNALSGHLDLAQSKALPPSDTVKAAFLTPLSQRRQSPDTVTDIITADEMSQYLPAHEETSAIIDASPLFARRGRYSAPPGGSTLFQKEQNRSKPEIAPVANESVVVSSPPVEEVSKEEASPVQATPAGLVATVAAAEVLKDEPQPASSAFAQEVQQVEVIPVAAAEVLPKPEEPVASEQKVNEVIAQPEVLPALQKLWDEYQGPADQKELWQDFTTEYTKNGQYDTASAALLNRVAFAERGMADFLLTDEAFTKTHEGGLRPSMTLEELKKEPVLEGHFLSARADLEHIITLSSRHSREKEKRPLNHAVIRGLVGQFIAVSEQHEKSRLSPLSQDAATKELIERKRREVRNSAEGNLLYNSIRLAVDDIMESERAHVYKVMRDQGYNVAETQVWDIAERCFENALFSYGAGNKASFSTWLIRSLQDYLETKVGERMHQDKRRNPDIKLRTRIDAPALTNYRTERALSRARNREPNPSSVVATKDLFDHTWKRIEQTTPSARDRQVLSLRYGLGKFAGEVYGEDYNEDEVGAKLTGITRQRVNQIVHRIRDSLHTNPHDPRTEEKVQLLLEAKGALLDCFTDALGKPMSTSDIARALFTHEVIPDPMKDIGALALLMGRKNRGSPLVRGAAGPLMRNRLNTLLTRMEKTPGELDAFNTAFDNVILAAEELKELPVQEHGRG